MKQCQYDYAPGQKVWNKVHDRTKLGVRSTGPYTIEQAHFNDMFTIELHPGLTECLSMCNVIQYCLRTIVAVSMIRPMFHLPGTENVHDFV
jgi:hypothetical protein